MGNVPGSRPKTTGSTMIVKCLLNQSLKVYQIWRFSSETRIPMVRPCQDLGVALLFAGCDPDHGPQLFHMDPSGTYVRYDAKAIGSGSEGAQQSLQEVFHKGMTLKEAIKHAMTILKQVMEEKLSETNVEVATVTKENGFQLFTGDELQNNIKDLS